MKKRCLLLALALLLTGCGDREAPVEEASPPVDETVREEVRPPEILEGATLTTEWPEYAPDVEEIWFTVRNETGEELACGMQYHLEQLGETGTWSEVPVHENVGWNDIGYQVPVGGELTLSCWMGMFDHDFSGGGTYRIVKPMGYRLGDGEDLICTGEFRLSADGAISKDRPYGFAPLDTLPENYDAEDGLSDGAAVFDDTGPRHLEAVDTFVEKVSRGIPCQLRVVQAYNENVPMVTDVIYEDDRFHWAMVQDGFFAEQYFSYLLTDGDQLYLGNSAAWDWEGDRRTLLAPTASAEAVAQTETLTALRLETNATRYKAWSPDGAACVGLSGDPNSYYWNTARGGETVWLEERELPEDFRGLRTVRWLDNGRFLLSDGGRWFKEVDLSGQKVG